MGDYFMTIELVLLGALTLTAYRPIKAQTDSSPNWTSIGEHVSKHGVAVSQDMLKNDLVHYGDILYIEGYGYKIVNDTMHERHTNHVDMLVFTKAEESAIGVQRCRRVWVLHNDE